MSEENIISDKKKIKMATNIINKNAQNQINIIKAEDFEKNSKQKKDNNINHNNFRIYIRI